MKKSLLKFQDRASQLYMLILLVVSQFAFAQPTVLGTQVVNGAYTTYNLNTVGGFKQVRLLASSSAATGLRTWEFATGTAASTNYTTNWRPYTGGNTISVNDFIPTSFANGAKYNTSSGGSSGLLPAITSGRYYTFNVSNLAAADNVMSILETAFNPVTISSQSRFNNTVNIVTSGTPNAAENIYVRYTTNAFATSTIVQATGSGTTWSATIPVTGSVTYYIYTSNRSKATIDGDVTTYGQGAHDMSTLSLLNNSQSNYTFTATATIAYNEITASNPSSTNPFVSGQAVNGNATFTGITRSAALTAASAANRFSASNWPTAASLDGTKYFEFTIAPNSGYRLNFTDFTYTGQVSSGAPTVVLRSSVDGFSSNIGTATVSGTTISLSAAAYQNVIAPITFRYYAFGLAATTTTLSINDFTFNGTVDVIPSAPLLSISGTTAHGSSCPTFSTTPITYTITNNGTVTATGVTVGSSDPQFVVSNLSSTTINSGGGTATYDVTFTPSSGGAKSATITVASVTSGSNSPTSSLTGTGTTPITATVTSAAASLVSNTTATLNGNVTALGVCPATTQKGFVYSQTSVNANPLNGGTGVTTTPVAGVATGAYTLPLTSLASGTGYTFKAYVFDGTTYTYGATTTFTTLLPADHLAFAGVPSTGNINANLSSFTVEARRPDNSVDATYTGNITISKASGPGTLSGTLTVAAVAGVATFTAVQFDTVGTVSLAAAASGLTGTTSSNITITLAPVSLGNYPFTGSATTAGPAARMVPSGVAANLTLSSITRTGLSVNASSGNDDDVLSVSPSSGTYGTSVNTAMYIEFIATPGAGVTLNPSSISLSSQRTGSGATTYAVRSSVDGFAANLGTNTTTTSYATTSVSLSGSFTTPVTYRIYPYGGSSTGFWRVDNIVLNGNVICIEPIAYNVTGGATVCETGSGTPIGLDGSQLNINYQLKLGGVDNGAPVAGTGSAISFGNHAVGGTYTVEASNTNGTCNMTLAMTGSAVVIANPASVGGSVSGSTTVCSASNSGTLTLGGYTGTITKWQSADDAAFTVNVLDIPNASDTLGYTNLIQTTYYRAVVTSGNCPPANSAVATITVDSAANGGSIAGDASVCYGNNNGSITVSGYSGTIAGWQSSLDNFATTVNPINNTTDTELYSNLTVTTYYRAVLSGGACGLIFSPVATISVSTSNVWTGADNTAWADADNWSCGTVPTAVTDVQIVAGANQPVLASNITIHSLTMATGTALVVPSGFNLTVTDAVVTQGTASLTVENDANLLQVNDVDNSGSITVERNSASLMRLDYTLWSSPVDDQNLLDFSSATIATRFYVYNPTTDLYNSVVPSTTDFAEGTGYLIRMPDNHPTTPTVWSGTFEGEPHNGDLDLTVTSGTYNAVGNPYPSTIDADAFINENNLDEALYFWRKTNNAATTSYATYTLAGGAGTNPNSGDPLGLIPNGVIQVGQGFIAKSTSATLSFNNDMRIADNNGQFLRTSSVERNRIWLNLTNTEGIFSQTMVAYMTGATQGVDSKIDGLFFNDSEVALTSVIEGAEYAVQGRALPFDNTDSVPLGFKAVTAGNYTIALDHADGLFEDSSQDIYLKDNSDNSTHDLRESSYTFATEGGVFNNRFEIVYQSTLGVTNPALNANQVVVYKQGQDIVVNSGKETMATVKVFDIRGRLLVQKENVNASEVKIFAGSANEVLIVKVIAKDGAEVSKKVVN